MNEQEQTMEESNAKKINEEFKEKDQKKKKEYTGIVHIYSSFNNTIVNVTDLSGSTISRYTGGMITKQDRLKANPTTAMFIAKKIEEDLNNINMRNLYVKMRGKTGSIGVGPGAHMIIKTLSKDGFKIINISDISRVPRGGPKKKGGRRGRRV